MRGLTKGQGRVSPRMASDGLTVRSRTIDYLARYADTVSMAVNYRKDHAMRTYVGIDANALPIYVGDTVIWREQRWEARTEGIFTPHGVGYHPWDYVGTSNVVKDELTDAWARSGYKTLAELTGESACGYDGCDTPVADSPDPFLCWHHFNESEQRDADYAREDAHPFCSGYDRW